MDTPSDPNDHHLDGGSAVEMTAQCTEPDDPDHDDQQSPPEESVKLSPWAFLMKMAKKFNWMS